MSPKPSKCLPFKLTLRRNHPKAPPSPSGDFRKLFRRLDTDGDGKISGEELQRFLAWAGEGEGAMTSDEAERAVRDLDTDGDGLVDYGDFERLMAGESGEGIRRAFEMFGADEGEGRRITPEGLRRVLGRLGDERSREECVAMIRAYDLDGNGVLDFDEFKRMMS